MIAMFAVGSGSTACKMLVGRHALVSFAYVGGKGGFLSAAQLERLHGLCASVVLDSGAFTAWSKGTPIDLTAYTEYVDAHWQRYRWVACLDAIGDGPQSLRNWRAMRGALSRGVPLVPVFHEGEDPEILDEYVDAGGLVGLGRTDGRKSVDATFAWYDLVFNRHPTAQFHAFGNGSPETLEPYPFASFDCTTWERDATYGGKHRWPWSRCSKEARMRAYIEALSTVEHRRQARQLDLMASVQTVETLS